MYSFRKGGIFSLIKIIRILFLVPNSLPNDVKKRVGIPGKSMEIENIEMHKKLQSAKKVDL